MAAAIRLRREGTTKRPYYRIVVADSRSPRDGRFIEMVGTYDPKVAENNATLELERVEYWLKCGAQPSETVRSIIRKARGRAKIEAATAGDQ